MNVKELSPTLAPLLDYLNNLSERAPVEELQARLEATDVSVADVADFIEFGARRYRRNLICQGEFYHLLAICWRSAQRSPVHDHAASTCGFRVLQGVATETGFEPTPSGLIKPTVTTDYHAGQVVASQDADIHQVSNLQAAGEDLVTLHIYSPPLLRMDTYSITDDQVSEYRPVIFEHAHGSGI